MKKYIIGLALAAVFLGIMLGGIRAYGENTDGEEASKEGYKARSAVLAEAATGQILYSQNPDERLAIASLTKIMTLLIAAEEMKAGRLSMSDEIIASRNAFLMDGSVIWLNEGEKMSVYDIVRSIVISSANDACLALAEHIAGSEKRFVDLMNKKAYELDMKNTHFVNCTGLDAKEHLSTASDVAKMASELRKYSCYDEFLLTRLSYVREGTKRETQLLNTNRLLNYQGITGLKTGTTDNAGYCFTATAKRNGMELVAVVLGAETDDGRFETAKALLDYGFGGFEMFSPRFDEKELCDVKVSGGVMKTVPIIPKEGLKCLIPKGQSGKVTYLYNIKKELSAPFEKGASAGKIIVLLKDETLFVVSVTVTESVEKLTFFKSLEYIFRGILY